MKFNEGRRINGLAIELKPPDMKKILLLWLGIAAMFAFLVVGRQFGNFHSSVFLSSHLRPASG